MEYKTVYMPEVDETFRVFTHKSGLRVVFSHKDLHTSYALLGVNFGSIYEKCLYGGELLEYPDGTAHFLEHQMFANPDGEDTFEKFSRLGANANAYTGNERTCYLFSTAGHFEECLEVLLCGVFSPWFAEKNVNKEKNIIIEELKMYRDDPRDAVYRALLRTIYGEHRLRRDICGTVGSVRSVTPGILYSAYEHFYRPSNVVLSLCGRFDEDRIEALLDRCLPAKSAPMPRVELYDKEKDPARCHTRRRTVYPDLTTPAVSIGVKGVPFFKGSREHLKHFNAMSVIGQVLFSSAGAFISEAIDDKLIPDTPSFEVVHTGACSYILFESFAYKPKELLTRFENCRKKLLMEGVSEEDLTRAKKSLYADFLENFNSSEGSATLYLSDLSEGIDTSDTAECIFSLTKEDVDRLIKELLQKERVCAVTAYPRSTKKGVKK